MTTRLIRACEAAGLEIVWEQWPNEAMLQRTIYDVLRLRILGETAEAAPTCKISISYYRRAGPPGGMINVLAQTGRGFSHYFAADILCDTVRPVSYSGLLPPLDDAVAIAIPDLFNERWRESILERMSWNNRTLVAGEHSDRAMYDALAAELESVFARHGVQPKSPIHVIGRHL